MRILVVSNAESRRTSFFIKAGQCSGVETKFVTYEELESGIADYKDTLIKLEPPCHTETGFVEYSGFCMQYIGQLERIAQIKTAETVRFFNNPQAIIDTLDKVKSKHALSGLSVTPLISPTLTGFDELENILLSLKRRAVFLKPRYGSGAGGIMALRQNHGKGQFVAYTTLAQIGGKICNTNRINRLTDIVEIKKMVGVICDTGALLESWMAKDTFEGENYDLRVVCQAGKVEYIVVRCSKGSITNLHLNNKAKAFENLSLSSLQKEQAYNLSIQATAKLGLFYSGVDILIEKDSGKPYIIEVNGQGDHIYQDMFNENNIYKNQIKSLELLLYGNR